MDYRSCTLRSEPFGLTCCSIIHKHLPTFLWYNVKVLHFAKTWQYCLCLHWIWRRYIDIYSKHCTDFTNQLTDSSQCNLWYWPTNEGRDHDDVHFLLHRKFGNVPVTQLHDVLSEWRLYRDGVLESDGLPPRLHPVNVSSEFAKYSSPG